LTTTYSVLEIPPFKPRLESNADIDEVGGTGFGGTGTSPTTYSVTREKSQDKYGDPGVYTGTLSLSDHLPHGKGVMNYESGRQYDGNWL
jgi:hypothetical protein